LFLLILSGIITPVLVEEKKENWSKELTGKISEIESEVVKLYKEKEHELINSSEDLKRKLHRVFRSKNISYGRIIRAVNKDLYEDYSVEVAAPNGKLIAWSDNVAIPQGKIFPLEFEIRECYFYRSPLITYLTITDTLQVESDLFYIITSIHVEKHYSLHNPYFKEINFTKEISDKFYTTFEADYSQYAQKTKDGRKYSFDLANNKGNKIGQITFSKPMIDASVNELKQQASVFQSFFSFLAYLFVAFGLRKDFREIQFRSVKILLLIIYFTGFRILLYYTGFPSNILEGPIVDPAYFSSAFGGGIVKSPAEFLVTNIFLIIISIEVYCYVPDYLRSSRRDKSFAWFHVLFIAVLLALMLITLRGLSAAMRSVIFDSTLRYFRDINIFPDFPSMVMNLNILMMGTAVVLILGSYVLLSLSFYQSAETKKSKLFFFYIFISAQAAGFVYVLVQEQPLISVFLSFLFICIIFSFAYHVYFLKRRSIFNYIYASLAASFITIILLNHFNLELEKESLKTTALEVNRPNENLFRFILNETLTNAAGNDDLINLFYMIKYGYSDSNRTDAAAFAVWSRSSLQKESLNSSVAFYDSDFNEIGEFNLGVTEAVNPADYLKGLSGNDEKFIRIINPRDSSKIDFIGLIPLIENREKLGYVSAAIEFDLQNLSSGEGVPDFLESPTSILNSVIDIEQLKIFRFTNSKITQIYGDIFPSRDETKLIINADYRGDNEAWLRLNLNEEYYITYSQRTEENGNEIMTAVLLKEKQISWNLFNFFKLFIIHSLFIVILLIVFLAVQLKSFRYSFRAQLLIAFLFISILPVVILAIYNREIVQQRTETEIFNKLNESSNYLINHIRVQLENHPKRDYLDAFENAAKEFNISFVVYESSDLIYSSKKQFYDAGLFNFKMNPLVYFNLNYLSYREILTKERIENLEYHGFYKKLAVGNKNFVVGVNNAFNKVNLFYTTLDFDVFLFGVYSLASIVIIIISTILANKISSPVRRLTKATNSVAHGDLNVELENKERGEMKELLNGFNFMTNQLQKNQAELAEMEREIAWKEMAKQVAHEIKNPLTPMKLAVQQLIASYKDKKGNFESIFEKLSVTLLNQIESLSLIASEFSRFARMPKFKIEKIDLIPVIKDTVNLFQDENIKINVHHSRENAFAEADQIQLRRLLINMIRNSIQAEATIINIEIASHNDYYIINISDNGKGIPEEFKNKIFEADFTTKEKGMGLGLKLAKRYLEGINGSIKLVDSAVKGAEFEITISKLKQKESNSAAS
jgi:signal transduction histidine kinase